VESHGGEKQSGEKDDEFDGATHFLGM